MKTTRSMPSFNGVAAGSTATLNLPIGLTYHSLELLRGGTSFTNAHIEELRLKAEGREIMVMTGAQLDSIQQFEGMAAAGTNITRLNFERYGLDTRGGRELTAIGTGYRQVLDAGAGDFNPTPIQTLQLEVDIASAASAPTTRASSRRSRPTSRATRPTA